MNNLFSTKHGFFKALLCGLVFLCGCTLDIHADPVTAFIAANWVSFAISAAFAAASYGISAIFKPKLKPQDKGKLQGDLKLQAIGEDVPILEQYGSSLGDGQGGNRTAGTIFYASQIRKTIVTVSGQSSGGGKGAPKPPPTREYHYFVDLAILIGRGSQRVKQVKANNDLLYQDFTHTGSLIGTTYEAESNTSNSGGLDTIADVDFSGNAGRGIGNTEWLQWNNIAASDDTAPVEMFIVYKSTQDIDIEVTINGSVQRAVLPDSFGIVANVNLPQTLTIGSSNTVRITNVTSGVVLSLDRIVVGLAAIIPPIDFPNDPCYLSGVRYEGWVNPEASYDYNTLRDPLSADNRGCEQYNYQANRNALGEVSATLPAGASLRWYPGNKTQLPDPMLQAHFESVYGAGSTPAFRNRCYVVLENFEITKYSTVPNFTFVTEHETVNSVGELFAARSLRAGLDVSEFDYSALDAVPLRGYTIAQKQAPAKEMELLCRIYDIDVYEDFDGVITGVIPDETVVATVPVEELDMVENPSTEDQGKPFAPVITTFRDGQDLPFFLDASFMDPSRDWEPRNVHSLREIDASDRKANIETGVVFTEVEAQKFVDRELHKTFVEKDGLQVKLPHKYTYLKPTDLIEVTDTDGSINKMRVKALDGWLPGVLDVKGVSREALEYPPRLFVVANANPTVAPVVPPAPIVGTFIDLALFDEQANPGFYVAAAVTDTHYVWQGAGLYRLGEDDEWEALAGIRNQATMGRTIAGVDGQLGDVPGGWAAGDWDDTNDVTIDLYYGELETLTDDQVLNDKRNYLIVGNEIIQFGTATKIGGFPNRWTVSHLQRQLSGTASDGHDSFDRAVLYNAACIYIEQNPNIAGTTRTYKFVGSGGDLDTASSVDWNWTGRTQHNDPAGNITDFGIPIIGAAPDVYLENGYWIIQIYRPTANGYTARTAEIHVRKASDDSLVRTWDIGDTVRDSILAQAFNCKVKYRWKNDFRSTGIDGWSAWSADTTITVGSVSAPPDTSGGGDPVPFPGGGGYCFTDPTDEHPGHEVLMADWTAKDIQDVDTTDFVMTWMPGGRLLPGKVAHKFREIVSEYHKLDLSDGDLGVTGRHPFEADWNQKIRVEDMEEGQTLRAWDRGWDFVEVTDKKHVAADIWVNNIEVEIWHRYLVRKKGTKKWKAVYNRKADPGDESF